MDFDLCTTFGYVLERLHPVLRFDAACLGVVESRTGRLFATTCYPASFWYPSSCEFLLSSVVLEPGDITTRVGLALRGPPDAQSIIAARLAHHEGLHAVLLLQGCGGRPRGSLNVEAADSAEICRRALNRYRMRATAGARGYDVQIVAASRTFLDLEERALRVAPSSAPALIIGPRGSGKESIAYAIHYHSARREKPFLAINSAVLSHDLAAAELFGYRKGSFTGAADDRAGKFEAVRGGTLFFDEITELPASVQPALLRVLDRGEIQRLGHHAAERVDVRIVAATNKDIRQFVDDGRFPADLFDRLNVHSLTVPPLCERTDDIPLLLGYFSRRFCHDFRAQRGQAQCPSCVATGMLPPCVQDGVLASLRARHWPGNVRQLRNTILDMVAESEASGLRSRDVPYPVPTDALTAPGAESGLLLQEALRRHVTAALEFSRGNKSAAARALGIPLSTLVSKMKRLRIQTPEAAKETDGTPHRHMSAYRQRRHAAASCVPARFDSWQRTR
jgi:DNA-binding NtrC family response regulator